MCSSVSFGPPHRAVIDASSSSEGVRDGIIERTRLDNGVVVLSEAIAGAHSVSMGVWVRQGSAHEAPAVLGVSHLLEHMVFKGTERRTASEIALALERLGGSLDAYTTREHTSYQARVLSRHAPEALDVLADLVLAPRLDPADLEMEREVVLEEIAQVEDTPDDLVFDLHAERFWADHSYGRPILGTRDTVGSIPVDALRDLHGRRYTGANFIVAAAGRVRHEAFVDHVAERFGSVSAGRPAPAVPPPTEPTPGTVGVRRESAQTHLVLGAPIPGHPHPDRYAHVLLSAALGGGMSSRLFQRIREELGLCYSIFTFQWFLREAGIAGVYVGTRPGTTERALAAIRAELDRVAEGGLDDGAFEDVRQQVRGQILLSLESTGARLHRLASLELHDEPLTGLDRLLERIDRVALDDLSRVARAHYGADRQFTLALGPSAERLS